MEMLEGSGSLMEQGDNKERHFSVARQKLTKCKSRIVRILIEGYPQDSSCKLHLLPKVCSAYSFLWLTIWKMYDLIIHMLVPLRIVDLLVLRFVVGSAALPQLAKHLPIVISNRLNTTGMSKNVPQKQASSRKWPSCLFHNVLIPVGIQLFYFSPASLLWLLFTCIQFFRLFSRTNY